MNIHKEHDHQDESLERAFREFCAAWTEGENPDLEEYCRRYPACEARLRDFVEKFVSISHSFKESREREGLALAESDPGGDSSERDELGDFQIVREMGRGGMGVVYEARQISLDRIVALKVLPAHLTLRPETIARFQREASTAAKLKHPGIVEIHAIGEERGNHFFAMDFVEGAPLDRVVRRLSVEEASDLSGRSLGLAVWKEILRPRAHPAPEENLGDGTGRLHDFWDKPYIEAVCRIAAHVTDSLEHAHRAGVVHRDVKPSNIMVREDGSCVLTDFGLALESSLPSLTVTGQLTGTPHYIAPEQADARRGAVDHRVDIYSMGVTLYEMLTLIRPFDGKTSQEVLDKIRTKPAPAPKSRNVLIPRDLETICMTAMDKDPGRRYRTAREFNDDLRAFLAYRPIKAQPAGLAARTYRLIRRNPAYSLAAALLFVVVVVAPLLFGIQQKLANIQIRKEVEKREKALQLAYSEREAKEAALREARKEANVSNRISNFLIEIFSTSGQSMADDSRPPLLGLVQNGVAAIQSEFADNENVQARLQLIMGTVYNALAIEEEAEPLLRNAMVTFADSLGEGHPMTVAATYRLGEALAHQGRYEEARALIEKAMAGASENCGEDHHSSLMIRNTLAILYSKMGLKDEEIESTLLRSLEIACRTFGEDHPSPIYCMLHLGEYYHSTKQPDKARSVLEKCLEKSIRVLGEDDRCTIRVIRALGKAYQQKGVLNEAESLLIRALEASRRRMGEDHPSVYCEENNLGYFYFQTGRLEEAEHYLTRALEKLRCNEGDWNRDTLMCCSNLAGLYIATDRRDDAVSLLKTNAAACRHTRGEANSIALGSCCRLIELLLDQDRFDEAKSWLDAALSGICISAGENPEYASNILHVLAGLYESKGLNDILESIYIDLYERIGRELGEDHPEAFHNLMHVGSLYVNQGRLEEALPCLKKCLDGCERILGDNHLYTIETLAALGSVHLLNGNYEDSKTCFSRALAALEYLHGSDHPDAIPRRVNLVECCMRLGQFDEAAALTREALDRIPPEHPQYVTQIMQLWMILMRKEGNASGRPLQGEAGKPDQVGLESPLILESEQGHAKLLTTLPPGHARLMLAVCESAYHEVEGMVEVEPDPGELPIGLYLMASLEQYNVAGEEIGDARSSDYPVFYLKNPLGAGPVSVTYSVGNEESQQRFTKGLVRHAVVEQFLNRINDTGEIPPWFVKGQAARIERYFHPDYIKWSVREALQPLGGFMELDLFFEGFDYTAREIHMAGLLCAYLESEKASEPVTIALGDVLFAIARKEGIAAAFRELETALVKDEAGIWDFIAEHSGE